MKIAICVHNLANGGAERVAAMWATGFIENGDEVIIVLSEKDVPIEYPVPSKVKIVNIWVSGNPLTRYLKKIWNLRKLIRHESPDVALAVLKPWSEWLLFATVGLKTRVINTEHNTFERPESAPMSREMYFRKFWLNKLFPAVTVLTEADRQVLLKRLKHVYTMPNPLAFEPYYEENEKEKVVLAAGRLDQWHVKGFDILIDAWGQVAPKHPDWKLYIAGRGKDEDKKRIEDWAEKLGIRDNIKLIGFQPELWKECRKASIFVLSSRYEGFGMVLIESMSQGCAPVAADYKGRASEIITNENEGIVCPIENKEAMAKSIEQLIVDENRRHILQRGAFQRAEFFDVKKTIERWYDIFTHEGIIK